MQLHPTREAFHVALAGAALVSAGIAARLSPVVAFGGAMLLAVAVGRAYATVTVARLREAGFEMVWRGAARVSRCARGEEVRLEMELRNRSGNPVSGVSLRPLASSFLEVRIDPAEVELPPLARVRLEMVVRGRRVGAFGIHGVSLEVRGAGGSAEGLFEVPLIFANPYGMEVLPKPLLTMVRSPLGGRARHAAKSATRGRPSRIAGGGDEVRELRDHVPGDSFRHIAWKATARRQKLTVREMEHQERDVVWLLLDTSVELLAGAPGDAPLDHAIDHAAAVAAKLLARGDRVGLALLATRVHAWIAPAGGSAQADLIARALAGASATLDADRSALEENDVALRVSEHARPLDPRGLEDLGREAATQLDRLLGRANALRERAPFAPPIVFARTAREQQLRQYLAAFGVDGPPRPEGERAATERTLVTTLERLVKDPSRPTLVHVWGPVPGDESALGHAVRALRQRRIGLHWTLPELVSRDPLAAEQDSPSVPAAVFRAVAFRAVASRHRSERALRRLGAHPEPQRSRRPSLPKSEGTP